MWNHSLAHNIAGEEWLKDRVCNADRDCSRSFLSLTYYTGGTLSATVSSTASLSWLPIFDPEVIVVDVNL